MQTKAVKRIVSIHTFSLMFAGLALAQGTTPVVPTALGLFRDGTWYMDTNANGVLDQSDRVFANFGAPGDLPVSGDWNGDGRVEVGVYRPSNATFYLDYNGSGGWDGTILDRAHQFGDAATAAYTGDRPVVGDWSGTGRTKIGVVKGCPVGLFACVIKLWHLDTNGDGVFNPVVDNTYQFGLFADSPVTGDWNNDGRTEIGTFRNGVWVLDNGNGVVDPADRTIASFGAEGDVPLAGDWTANVITNIGVFRPSTRSWFLDTNANGIFEPGVDRTVINYGLTGDLPVVGRWNAGSVFRMYSGRIGYFSNGQFQFDVNDNGIYDSPPIDTFVSGYGLNVDRPFIGDWNNDGNLEIGVFRGGAWFLDYNSNDQWDPPFDRSYYFGLSTDIPIVGDWNGDGQTDIGVFRAAESRFFLDYNGNGTWDAGDRAYTFGLPTDMPVAGDWNGDGQTDIGVFRGGSWILDTNGNGTLDGTDRTIAVFGAPGDLPIAGDWGGTGKAKVGVYRQGQWFFDSNDNGAFDVADRIVPSFGTLNDKPFIWGVPVAP